MKITAIERLKLWQKEWEMKFSDSTSKMITQILVHIRENSGHNQAETQAKEIRELIETGISERELQKQLAKMK